MTKVLVRVSNQQTVAQTLSIYLTIPYHISRSQLIDMNRKRRWR